MGNSGQCPCECPPLLCPVHKLPGVRSQQWQEVDSLCPCGLLGLVLGPQTSSLGRRAFRLLCTGSKTDSTAAVLCRPSLLALQSARASLREARGTRSTWCVHRSHVGSSRGSESGPGTGGHDGRHPTRESPSRERRVSPGTWRAQGPAVTTLRLGSLIFLNGANGTT